MVDARGDPQVPALSGGAPHGVSMVVMDRGHHLSLNRSGELRLIARVGGGSPTAAATYRFRHHLTLVNDGGQPVSLVAARIVATDDDGQRHDALPRRHGEAMPETIAAHGSLIRTSVFELPSHWGTIEGWIDVLDALGRCRRIDCHRVICHSLQYDTIDVL